MYKQTEVLFQQCYLTSSGLVVIQACTCLCPWFFSFTAYLPSTQFRYHRLVRATDPPTPGCVGLRVEGQLLLLMLSGREHVMLPMAQQDTIRHE